MNFYDNTNGWQRMCENSSEQYNEYMWSPINGMIPYQYNAMQLPLINRLKMGPQFCTIQEWDAAQWLYSKFQNPASRYNPISYIQHMRYQAKYSGTCWIEVPIPQDNLELPQIVNEIMSQLGGVLIDTEVYYRVVGTCYTVPNSVILVYKTVTPDIRNR